MVSTPSMPTPTPAPVQQTEEETKEKTQQEIVEAERKRKGRAETVLTSQLGDTSNVNTMRKTLLGG